MNSEQSEARGDRYRDLLETWAEWWNNVGRRSLNHYILPPITATGDALACSICSGETGEGRCAACGRRMSS